MIPHRSSGSSPRGRQSLILQTAASCPVHSATSEPGMAFLAHFRSEVNPKEYGPMGQTSGDECVSSQVNGAATPCAPLSAIPKRQAGDCPPRQAARTCPLLWQCPRVNYGKRARSQERIKMSHHGIDELARFCQKVRVQKDEQVEPNESSKRQPH